MILLLIPCSMAVWLWCILDDVVNGTPEAADKAQDQKQ